MSKISDSDNVTVTVTWYGESFVTLIIYLIDDCDDCVKLGVTVTCDKNPSFQHQFFGR